MASTVDCAFCHRKALKNYYTCPRCCSVYCGLGCYRCPGHQKCSESFYKECVEEELATLTSDKHIKDSGAKAMREILARVHQEGGELDDDGEASLDSDDDEELSERIKGINLDDTEVLWSKLTNNEKQEFQSLVKSGEIEKYVPDFKPWWDWYKIVANRGAKIEVLDENLVPPGESLLHQTLERIPRIEDTLVDVAMKDLMGPGRKPSQLVRYGLGNVLYGYAYGVRYFLGDHEDKPVDFLELLLRISSNLCPKRRHNFSSFDLALESGASCANQAVSYFVSLQFSKEVKKDVFKLIRGPGEISFSSGNVYDNLYILSALSDMKRLLRKGLDEVKSKNIDPLFAEMKELKRVLKKIDFYLLWTRDNYGEFEL